jgi:23S rRNA (pseudouridine1915-N3)-methyltransferase
MQIGILAVGRLKSGPILALFEDYARRLKWPLAVTEVEERRRLPHPALKEREGALLLDALENLTRKSRHSVVIALDERGTAFTSTAFAQRLGSWRDQGLDPLFIIGGADGLAPPVLERAGLTLALGVMTWPHLLVRVLLVEQLYRAQSILEGHPYHRE